MDKIFKVTLTCSCCGISRTERFYGKDEKDAASNAKVQHIWDCNKPYSGKHGNIKFSDMKVNSITEETC